MRKAKVTGFSRWRGTPDMRCWLKEHTQRQTDPTTVTLTVHARWGLQVQKDWVKSVCKDDVVSVCDLADDRLRGKSWKFNDFVVPHAHGRWWVQRWYVKFIMCMHVFHKKLPTVCMHTAGIAGGSQQCSIFTENPTLTDSRYMLSTWYRF